MSDTVDQILAQAPPGVSLAAVARVAGFHPNFLSQLRTGRKRLTPATVARLRLALTRLRAAEADGPAAAHALYRSLLVVAAHELGRDPLAVQCLDVHAKRTADERWNADMQAHKLARWAMNQVFGFSQADIARAIGLTKQAVSLSMDAVTVRCRSDDGFARLLAGLREKLTGMAR